MIDDLIKSNEKIKELSKKDLIELLNELNIYLLEYRNNINIPDDITFGIEIEYEGLQRLFVDSFCEKKLSNWTSKSDGSLISGGEITSPILHDKEKNWLELQKICSYLNRKQANTSKNAGGHIHIGYEILGEDIEAWKTFLKTYAIYENIIFRFAYGDKINPRPTLKKYAPPIAEDILYHLPEIEKSRKLSELPFSIRGNPKYSAITFKNVPFVKDYYRNKYKQTIEFRLANSTTSEVIWQNNINAFTKLLLSAKNKSIDTELVDYRIKEKDFYTLKQQYLYEAIDLPKVIEYIDLVFDNNLDKLYFLRQYIKDWREIFTTSNDYAIKSKNFVK